MRKALVRQADGLVVNVILLEDGADWPVPEGHELQDATEAGGPGDTWDGTQYITPEPPVKHWWNS